MKKRDEDSYASRGLRQMGETRMKLICSLKVKEQKQIPVWGKCSVVGWGVVVMVQVYRKEAEVMVVVAKRVVEFVAGQ